MNGECSDTERDSQGIGIHRQNRLLLPHREIVWQYPFQGQRIEYFQRAVSANLLELLQSLG